MKKLLVVLSVVLVLALASGAFAATGHVGHYTSNAALAQAGRDYAVVSSTDRALFDSSVSFIESANLGSSSSQTVPTAFSSNYDLAAIIPNLTGLEDGKTYVIGIVLNVQEIFNNKVTNGAFAFLPMASSSNSNYNLFYNNNGTRTALTYSTIAGASSVPTTLGTYQFLMFKYSSTATDGIAASGTDGKLTPMLLYTSTAASDPGSSGGGCVAGTSALALAVLGLFIAKGKK